ncbi:MAG: hypothetical protein CMP21_00465 [Rickettsiales bacterium]|nr:hypothetical protein [Rickettsiales bacterium]|tara:strand:+ start:12310 stop:12717 length:408 start_codon:yes stop_codon:yes gene_type:complete
MWQTKKLSYPSLTFLDSVIQDVADYGIGMQNLPTVIKETDSAILVSVSVPGIEKEALDIQYEEGYLTVGIDSVDVDKDSDSVTHLSEFSLGKQKRTYYIPDVNVDSMDASLKNGVLTVTLAKLDSVKPVSISISS